MTVRGAAGLHLVSGVPLLRPEEAVFAAVLDGWRDQQAARTSTGHDKIYANRNIRGYPSDACSVCGYVLVVCPKP